MNKKLLVISVATAVATISGCSSEPKAPVVSADANTSELKSAIAKQQSVINSREQQIADLKRQLEAKSATPATTSTDLLPPAAKPGECFARVFIEPVYKTETVRVQKTAASENVSIIPAKYGYETKQIVTREATEVVDVIPAKYGYKTEKVLVSPPITELRTVPAVYKTETETIVVKPATTEWKKGTPANGAISSKVDSATGEVMCLVEVPAVTRTVSKRVLVTPATAKEVVVQPAQYKNVRTRIMTEAPKTVTRQIPAQYGTVKVKKVIEPARSITRPVPATFANVTKRTKVSEGYIKWAPVLCEVNATPSVIRGIQSKLKKAGYYHGPLDGIIGRGTTNAVKKYQHARGLATGGITLETVKALGVSI